MKVKELLDALISQSVDMEVRIGDVSEASDLHCSVGTVEVRSGCVILTPGDDDIWKDETLATSIISEQLYPKE